ncbi:MAG: glycosyltransferase [Deltaproteobacteria bacterium]|nr:glycosyltransferase [Deltaproteobacteria bacterium]
MTSLHPNICVLIPTYNHARYVAQCLQSILSQTLRPTKIKVFDDYSVDGTWDIIQNFASREPNIFEVFRNDRNIGPYENGLRVWAAVDGDYCAFIEGDDFWCADKLKGEYDALLAYPEAGAAYSNIALTDEEGKVTCLFHHPNDGPMQSGNIFELIATRRIFPRTRNCFRNYLFRTECFRSLNWRLDNDIPTMGDYNLHLCFTERYPFAASRNTSPMVFYRRHQGGVSQNRHDVHFAQMLIYEKYDESFNRLPVEQELNCRVFQETQLSFMRADFPEDKSMYYAPGAVYERMINRIAALPPEMVDKIWRTNIDLFRQLTIGQIVELFREGRDQEALAAWLRYYRNEIHPLDGWFSLTPEIYSRLQAAHRSYLNSRKVQYV